jgi:hypothetical protein
MLQCVWKKDWLMKLSNIKLSQPKNKFVRLKNLFFFAVEGTNYNFLTKSLNSDLIPKQLTLINLLSLIENNRI